MKEPHHVESQIVSFCLNIVPFTSQYFYQTPVRSMPGLVSYSATNALQTWNLSKNLHRWIFRLRILHRQFYLISTVLVRKKHKKWVKMEKFTPLAKILHCLWHWRHWQIPPLNFLGGDYSGMNSQLACRCGQQTRISHLKYQCQFFKAGITKLLTWISL